MSQPVPDQTAALRAFVEPYIEHALSADRATCEHAVDLYEAWRDQAHERGDVHAEALHARLALLYRAVALTDRAAEIVMLDGDNPLDQP